MSTRNLLVVCAVLLIALVAAIICSGCIPSQDTAGIQALTDRLQALEVKAEEVVSGVEAGNIPFRDGLEILREVNDLKADTRAEIDKLKASGYKWWEIVGAIAGSLLGVRAWRGPSHKKPEENLI